MSIFTNAASDSAAEGRAYTRAILELLGSAEPLEVLAVTPARLRSAIEGLSGASISTPEAPGKWSIRELLRHLADSELVWSYRLRSVLAEDRPALAGYDQDAWSDRLRYREENPEESLETFTLLRRANLRLVADAAPSDLDRVGIHAERGEESVAHMLRLYAGHDLVHLRQLERIRDAVA